MGRAGGPYIRLTLLWTRSTITILSKASKALHHPPSRKTIIHVYRVPSAAVVVVRGRGSPTTGFGGEGGPPFTAGRWIEVARLWAAFVAMSTSNGRSLLSLLLHPRRCWPTRSTSTRRATPSATEHHPGYLRYNSLSRRRGARHARALHSS